MPAARGPMGNMRNLSLKKQIEGGARGPGAPAGARAHVQGPGRARGPYIPRGPEIVATPSAVATRGFDG